ncbi:Sensor protein CzcS precursor [Pirellulimonas nuda]|uniref:histidine kinase n=1 Tax=Pirellulimonas nuda TaxID=2528009 RepID=A0A518D8E6_9BACT|nr:ATP-binding protein [Pirellulimonas nuda]QDU87724.1 Sensor protein CzcS precursor [Pirellulimonas nuda]
MTSSIRARVLIASTLVISLVLLVAGLAVYALLRNGLSRQFDVSLMASAEGLARAFEYDSRGLHCDREGLEGAPRAIFRAWNTAGSVVAQSGGNLTLPPMSAIDLSATHDGVQECRLSDGSSARGVRVNFMPHVDSDYPGPEPPSRIILVAAVPLAEVEQTLSLAARQLALALLGGVLLAPLVLWPVTRLVVRPVEAIASRISRLDVAELDARLDPAGCPIELRPIVQRLNETIARLEDAFQRERAATANIAHELRTPLAGLRATIELATTRPRATDYYQQTLAECRQMTAELETLVERVLLLSRLDAGRLPQNPERIDVGGLLRACWDEAVRRAPQPPSGVRWDIDEGLTLTADRACARQVLRNLLANAVDHGAPDKPIAISAARSAAGVELRIANTSARPVGGDVQRLKQRFVQQDENRSRTGRNAGLGLSICDELVRQMGGELSLCVGAGDRFTAVVSLPGDPGERGKAAAAALVSLPMAVSRLAPAAPSSAPSPAKT